MSGGWIPARIGRRRSGPARWLYPRVLDPRVLAATDAYLARPDVPSGLRRLLAEGRADVERSIAAQELDASGPHRHT